MERARRVLSSEGECFDTPLLIPSFSSRGFRKSADGSSEIYEFYKTASESLTSSMLVSAFDISKGYFPPLQDLDVRPDLIVIDSGGYETGVSEDSSPLYFEPASTEAWSLGSYKEALRQVSDVGTTAIVNYDADASGLTYNEQIERAANFFEEVSPTFSTILLKPEAASGAYHDLASLKNVLSSLSSFSIIGVTEKELGSSLKDRAIAVRALRLALDEDGVTAPIHVFGCLEPYSSLIYFLAGAELFDGLSWLRYLFGEQALTYMNDSAARLFGLEKSDNELRALAVLHNLDALASLEARMKEFAETKEFALFESYAEDVRTACAEIGLVEA